MTKLLRREVVVPHRPGRAGWLLVGAGFALMMLGDAAIWTARSGGGGVGDPVGQCPYAAQAHRVQALERAAATARAVKPARTEPAPEAARPAAEPDRLTPASDAPVTSRVGLLPPRADAE